VLGNSALNEILNIFVEQTPDRLSALQNLLGQHEFEKLGSLAHNLKSSCLAVGAKKASLICQNIELAVLENRNQELPEFVDQLYSEINVVEKQIKYFLANSLNPLAENQSVKNQTEELSLE